MKRFLIYCLIFILPVLVVSFSVFLQPLDKRFAYNFVKGDCSERGIWIHDRLYENDMPIDIAIVGSSVGWGLFDDKRLSELLTSKAGKEVIVSNLSYCRGGFNLRALFVEELIATKSPKKIIIELRHEPNRGGHPMYGYLASTDNLVFPATYLYQRYLTDLKHGLIVRWETLRTMLYPYSEYKPNLAAFGVSPDHGLVDQQRMHRLLKQRQDNRYDRPESFQDKIHFYVYWKNMEYVKQLCDRHNIELVFFYVNEFGNPSIYPKYKSRIEAIAPIWFAPDSIFQNPEYYVDIAHFNQKGTDAITPVLFKYLEQDYE